MTSIQQKIEFQINAITRAKLQEKRIAELEALVKELQGTPTAQAWAPQG